MRIPPIDADTARAAEAFLTRIAATYPVSRAILVGSRARHDHTEDSDADIAVILTGEHGGHDRVDIVLDMASIAFDVLLDTRVLVEALPLWESEFENPERFSNPALIDNIRREGILLWPK
jgi:uncharacterized protein